MKKDFLNKKEKKKDDWEGVSWLNLHELRCKCDFLLDYLFGSGGKTAEAIKSWGESGRPAKKDRTTD